MLQSLEEVTHYETKQVIDAILAAAVQTEQLLDECVQQNLKPGITEKEMEKLLLAMAEERHAGTQWHKPYIRFGANTLLTYRDKATECLTLQENDLCFVDFGPVCDLEMGRFEGDLGKTWLVGNDPEMTHVQKAGESLFNKGLEFYRTHQPTGMALYNWLGIEAQKLDVLMSLPDAGHLIGEFPHLRWKSGLCNYPEIPAPGCWILEIQVRHPEKAYGAFYENVLI